MTHNTIYGKTVDIICDEFKVNGTTINPVDPTFNSITLPGETYSSATSGASVAGVFQVTAAKAINNMADVHIRCTTAATSGGEVPLNIVTTLSASFRPVARQYAAGVLITNAGAQVPYGGYIEPTGNIVLFILTNGASPVFTTGSLCAVGNTLHWHYPTV